MANINNEVHARKKGGIGKFLLILFIVLIILIVLPIALVYILLYDSGAKSVKHYDTLTSETYMKAFASNVVADSLNNTKDTGKINFSLSEDNVNTLLYYALNEKLPSAAKEYVTGAYLDIGTNKYKFYVIIITIYEKVNQNI